MERTSLSDLTARVVLPAKEPYGDRDCGNIGCGRDPAPLQMKASSLVRECFYSMKNLRIGWCCRVPHTNISCDSNL
jgi:hypothetical protein